MNLSILYTVLYHPESISASPVTTDVCMFPVGKQRGTNNFWIIATNIRNLYGFPRTTLWTETDTKV